MSEEILNNNGESTELTTPENFGQGMAFLNPSEMPDLESAEVGFNIKPEYHEFVNVGDSLRAVFNGIGSIKTKDRQTEGLYKNIPAVVLQNKDGVKLNAGASLVSQFQNMLPGCAVQITYKGKEKTKGGNEVKAYEVRLLNVPRVNVPVQLAITSGVETIKAESIEYKNAQYASDFWNKAYHEMKFTEQDGKDHLKEFGYDFKAALEALGNPF